MASLKPRVLARIAWGFVLLAAAAGVGFWPSYFALLLARGSLPPLVHVHMGLMVLWCGLLIVQPLLARARAWSSHRRLGRLAGPVAVLTLLTALALAVLNTRPTPGAPIEAFRYGLFFVQVSAALIFGGCVTAGLWWRHDLARHARWMLASGLSFVDPIFARVFSHLGPTWPAWPDWPGHASIGLAILLALVFLGLDRDQPEGRRIWGVLALGLALNGAGGAWLGDWQPWRRLMEDLFN